MRAPRWCVVIPVLLLVGTVLARTTVTAGEDREITRLRAHFDAVDRELRGRDVSALSPLQQTRRTTVLNWLREYRDAGVFPQNWHIPDRAVPIFRDDRGVLCAMAYLIARSGGTAIVDRIAQTRNLAYITELANDADLRVWLNDFGLTLAEAARIQPQYHPCGSDLQNCPSLTMPKDASVGPVYGIVSVISGGASVVTMGRSLAKPTRERGWAAVLSGSAEFLLGAAKLKPGWPTPRTAVANMGVGAVTIAAGVRALVVASHRPPAIPSSGRGAGLQVDLSLLPPVNAMTSQRQRGIQLHISF